MKADQFTMVLAQAQSDITYKISGKDAAGHITEIAFVLEGKEIKESQTLELETDKKYRMAEGTWKVAGDNTNYCGGVFYVPEKGTYEFSNEN